MKELRLLPPVHNIKISVVIKFNVSFSQKSLRMKLLRSALLLLERNNQFGYYIDK
jgi:hypothetical protein